MSTPKTLTLTYEVQTVLARGLQCITASEDPGEEAEAAARTTRRALAAIGLFENNGGLSGPSGARSGFVRTESGGAARVTKDGTGIWRGSRYVGGRREELRGVTVYLDERLDIIIYEPPKDHNADPR